MTREWEAAAKGGALDVLRRLHADGADVNARDGHGQTALMLAAHGGHEEAVAWLIEAGAALDRTAKHGLSAVMLAVICGHVAVVRRLAEAGASLALRGTGESFAGQTALDLAVARNHAEMVEILRSRPAPAIGHSHFETATSWKTAPAFVVFQPLQPAHTANLSLQSLRIHVRDHKRRNLRIDDRTLEAHYGRFVLSQARKGVTEARRLALDVSYGPAPQEARIAGHDARLYELGPEPEPGDIDGRNPAVVTWHDGEMFYLIASSEMAVADLTPIAMSMYPSAAAPGKQKS